MLFDLFNKIHKIYIFNPEHIKPVMNKLAKDPRISWVNGLDIHQNDEKMFNWLMISNVDNWYVTFTPAVCLCFEKHEGIVILRWTREYDFSVLISNSSMSSDKFLNLICNKERNFVLINSD